ncbi:MAG: hypothetical protein PHQ40_09965 [Anaerolineaceae bacterium]|nr:hypothetical protein [Anaerolineaceae bacterium]
MDRTTRLTGRAYYDFLAYLFFGPLDDPLQACIDRAYCDFNRTLHHLSAVEHKTELHQAAVEQMRQSFGEVRERGAGWAASDFDRWHRSTCQALCELYARGGFDRFCTGQAQKWVNMTFKYIYTLGEERLPGYQTVYACCHVPIDNIIIDRLTPYGLPALDGAWSRISSYEHYQEIQCWIRETFLLIPLDLEFKAWLVPTEDLTAYLSHQ